VTPSTQAERLVEREDEIARLRRFIEAAAGGEGKVVLVAGEPGIGKTALLGAAARHAAQSGFSVLAARGARLERDFAYGVTRQLFERVVHGTAVLDGAAHLARRALGDDAGAAAGTTEDIGFATNHGLYWLTANLAEQGPILLVVDDAHWADPATLLFLNYLGRRLEGLPVLVAIGMRWAEPGAAQDLLDALRDAPGAEVVEPAALSEEASGALIEQLLGCAADPAFRHACREVTGGNPFLLSELVRALAADGVAPVAAAAARVRRLAPDTIARSVLSRLGTMPAGAIALAQAVAVLDAEAELRHAAALVDIALGAAQTVADELAAAHILAGDRPLRFAHPVMRQAVYDDLPMGKRARLHARAARLLDTGGDDPDRAAVHLLAAEPAADPWVLDRLRTAATRALTRGAPGAAVTLLRRAVSEPPAAELWAEVLLELGRAERLAGAGEAVVHLRQVQEATTDAALRIAAARELATALAAGARVDEASAVLEQAIAETADHESALMLEAQLFGLSQASDALAATVAVRLERVCRDLRGSSPGERLALAANVFHRAFVGQGSAEEVTALARVALGEGRLMKEATGDHFAFYGPLIALRDSDHHDEVRPLLEEAAADARRRGSPFAVAATLSTLARLEQLQGDLAAAEAAAQTAFDAAASSPQYRLMLLLAASSLLLVLVEQGRLDDAESVLAGVGMTTGPPPPASTGNNFLAGRARLRLAQGRVAEAVEDTNMWLERQRLRGGLNPVGASSILHPALPFMAIGDQGTATTLAEEMLAVATRWGVAGQTGSCRTVLGLVTGGDEGLRHLRDAVALLEQSPRRLDRARALIELGAALRRANSRSEARSCLQAGMELAHRCGAVPLAERALDELRATGARPRKLTFTGVRSLTAQERRVADLAAAGMGNREIAQSLFVTRRTVETHLGHVYQKLGLSSRDLLRDALSDAGDEP
jgi:DNA-binding CsgD family transcriptional regulator